jgi:hypothetical protein
MLRWLKQMLLLNILLVPPMVIMPLLCFLPLWLVATHQQEDFGTIAAVTFFAAPFSCSFWVLIYSQWSSARAWQRMGRLRDWRKDHGGIVHTVVRATAWMCFGLVGSFICEGAFIVAFRVAFGSGAGSSRLTLWFSAFPFAAYAPLFAAWAWRRRHAYPV